MGYRGIWTALALAGLALGQQTSQKKEAPPPAQAKPAPLFGGKLGIRASQSTKESATLGFNGIDPSGKVDQQMLAAQPGAADVEKVKKLGEAQPTPADLEGFVKEGALNKP